MTTPDARPGCQLTPIAPAAGAGPDPAGAAHDADNATPAGFHGTTQAAWDAALRRRRTRRPGTCHVPGCGDPAHLYPGGILCDRHRPRTPEGGNAA